METTRILRENGYSHLPIIGCTADAMLKHKKEFLDAGVNVCLSKPIDKSDLLFSINRILNDEIHVPIDENIEKALNNSKDSSILINYEELMILKENVGDDILVSLLEGFISSTPEQLSKLKTAITKQEFKQAKDLAHTIRGSAATFGFIDMVSHSKNIELANYKSSLFSEILTEHEKLISSFEKTKMTIECDYL